MLLRKPGTTLANFADRANLIQREAYDPILLRQNSKNWVATWAIQCAGSGEFVSNFTVKPN